MPKPAADPRSHERSKLSREDTTDPNSRACNNTWLGPDGPSREASRSLPCALETRAWVQAGLRTHEHDRAIATRPPTDYRFPGCRHSTPSACDSVRSHSPLRGSPGLTPGSLLRPICCVGHQHTRNMLGGLGERQPKTASACVARDRGLKYALHTPGSRLSATIVHSDRCAGGPASLSSAETSCRMRYTLRRQLPRRAALRSHVEQVLVEAAERSSRI